MSGARLEVRGLRHDLAPGAPLLDLAAFSLAPGQFAVLSGPSGSGKTTLLYLLCGLLTPVAGQIAWDGDDLAALPGPARDGWRRNRAGFVFQDFHLIPEMSPLDNVLAPAWFSRFSARALRGQAQDLLDRFGVPARKRTAVLSRGEQQRVALARALLQSPAVIFADEPTASLDAEAGQLVTETLRALARDEGRTIIAASHDPALIARADTRLRLVRGQSVEVP